MRTEFAAQHGVSRHRRERDHPPRQQYGTKVTILVDIEADRPAGFDTGVQRTVRENCNILKFKRADLAGE